MGGGVAPLGQLTVGQILVVGRGFLVAVARRLVAVARCLVAVAERLVAVACCLVAVACRLAVASVWSLSASVWGSRKTSRSGTVAIEFDGSISTGACPFVDAAREIEKRRRRTFFAGTSVPHSGHVCRGASLSAS